jgi:tetratricopeptide (TPR) repeat protein
MQITHHKEHGLRLPALMSSKPVLFSASIIGLLPVQLFAQRLQVAYWTGPVALVPRTPDDLAGETKTCWIQPFPGMTNMASVTSLQIPHKAQKEYEQACEAVKNKKMPEAEKHLRKATEIYPNCAAGWVMLGQILETRTRQRSAGAREACSRASGSDSNYLPAYLCSAETAEREQRWHEVLNLTSRALELDPSNDAYALFFQCNRLFQS